MLFPMAEALRSSIPSLMKMANCVADIICMTQIPFKLVRDTLINHYTHALSNNHYRDVIKWMLCVILVIPCTWYSLLKK